MKWWLVSWVKWELPGGWLAAKMVPDHLEPLLGRPRILHEAHSHEALAVRRVKELPQLARPTLVEVDGLRLDPKKVSYTTQAEVDT